MFLCVCTHTHACPHAFLPPYLPNALGFSKQVRVIVLQMAPVRLGSYPFQYCCPNLSVSRGVSKFLLLRSWFAWGFWCKFPPWLPKVGWGQGATSYKLRSDIELAVQEMHISELENMFEEIEMKRLVGGRESLVTHWHQGDLMSRAVSCWCRSLRPSTGHNFTESEGTFCDF